MSSELVERTETTPPLAARILSGSVTFTKRQPLAAAGLFIIIVMCVIAAAADVVTWYDPIEWRLKDKLSSPFTESAQEPFRAFIMGTDDKGRDIWAQMAVGAQVSLMVGFLSVAFGSGIGGVLEPMQANPTIIEDDCFVGARAEIAEGVIVEKGSVLSMGVYIGASTRIIDRSTGEIHYGKVPPYSVIVPGAMPSKNNPDGPSLYCVIIVKKVDEKTRSKTSINDLLRD